MIWNSSFFYGVIVTLFSTGSCGQSFSSFGAYSFPRALPWAIIYEPFGLEKGGDVNPLSQVGVKLGYA